MDSFVLFKKFLLLVATTVVIVVSTSTSTVTAEERCYRIPEIGYYKCFNNDPPFNHIPLPSDAQVIKPTLFLLNNWDKTWTAISDFNHLKYDNVYLLTHGFKEHISSPWVDPLMQALSKLPIFEYDTSIVFIDWKLGAAHGPIGPKWYSLAASNTRVIGSIIGHMLHNSRLKVMRSTCIGFSLGAHVCGFISKQTYEQTNKTKLLQIFAADPAGPCFDTDVETARLARADAESVLVMHTSWFGLRRPIGNYDFYVNGAVNQPGCYLPSWISVDITLAQDQVCKGSKPTQAELTGERTNNFYWDWDWSITCGHVRAIELLIYSLNFPECFDCCRDGTCNEDDIVPNKSLFHFCPVGYRTCRRNESEYISFNPYGPPGVYAGTTTSHAPFCK